MNNASNVFVTGDMTHLGGTRYMMIERDDFQGPPTIANPPRQKKLYLFDLGVIDHATGLLKKRLIVDLLDIADPDSKAHVPLEPSGRFVFPYQGPEGVAVVGPDLIAVINDNNLPYNAARRLGQPDGSELIVLRVSELMAAR